MRLLALMVLIGLLAGCGQKGPLFLPKPAKPAAPAATAPPAPASSRLPQPGSRLTPVPPR